MKQKLLQSLAVALLFSANANSQSIAPFALNVAGGSYDNTSSYARFEWNFGELVLTDTYKYGSLFLTQGLLQPCTDLVTKSSEILFFGSNEWKIFPNVTQGLFELDFFLNIPGQMDLQLTNAIGQIINTRSFQYHCCSRIERYDLSNFANGIYFINAVFTPDRGNIDEAFRVRRKGTFRVVKMK